MDTSNDKLTLKDKALSFTANLLSNAILFFTAFGICLWIGKWLWGNIKMVTDFMMWLYGINGFLFTVACVLLAVIFVLMGLYSVTNLKIFLAERNSFFTLKIPGGYLEYTDGFGTDVYQKADGHTYVDAVMIAGGITPVTDVPIEKIVRTPKSIPQILGLYLAPIFRWGRKNRDRRTR